MEFSYVFSDSSYSFVLSSIWPFKCICSFSCARLVTNFGVFAGCKEAVAFRDGPLVSLLDQSLAGYKADREDALAKMVAKYQASKLTKINDIAATTVEQKRILEIAGAQLLAALALEAASNSAIKSLGAGQFNEREALKAVVNGANGLESPPVRPSRPARLMR